MYSTNYDPVREAAAENAAAGITSSTYSTGGGGEGGGGPSQPKFVHRGILEYQLKDTQALANYMSECPRGNTTYNCGLERPAMNGKTYKDLANIWAHVKAEHPEFANNCPLPNTTIINDTLINNVASLNTDYSREWP